MKNTPLKVPFSLKEPLKGSEDTGQHFVGKNPLELGGKTLVEMGLTNTSPIKAIRKNCVECSGGSPKEARLCVHTGCPLWPFRMGKSPYRQKPKSKSYGGEDA